MWTPYGLRSLSKLSSQFKKNNNYWTNPIWIQINYLVLRGLKLYYSADEKANKIYKDLRDNLIENVCGNYERTGFFFENYNKERNGWVTILY